MLDPTPTPSKSIIRIETRPMPEVIEVLKYADFLRTKLKNKQITEINVLGGRYKKHGDFAHLDTLKASLPQKVVDIQTKGKFLYLTFENGLYLFSTLGLSGGWVWSKDNKSFEFEEIVKYIDKTELEHWQQGAIKHRNVEFKTKAGSVYFYDMLSFGTLKVVQTEAELNKKLNSIGPDITAAETTLELFTVRLKKAANEKLIGNVLMNQRLLSGIGNYLRADVLWLTKISPFRKMHDLTDADVKKIYTAAKLLAHSKYDYKAAIKDHLIPKDHPPTPEDYGREFYVYNSTVDPDGHPVKKEELYEGSQKRFIYWVPSRQK